MRRGSIVALCALAVVADTLTSGVSPSQVAHAQTGDRNALSARRTLHFSIPSGTLADALTKVSEQSGWQIVYDANAVSAIKNKEFNGRATVGKTLDRLLDGSRLTWSYVNQNTIAVRVLTPKNETAPIAPVREVRETAAETAAFSDINVFTDAPRTHASEHSTAAFGFNKPLLETPRSITLIDADTIDRLELSAVEDLVRVVPGVFTTTRFGIQGAVDIRNVPADTYFRGMKRLTLQGHGRSVLAAMDTIEIVGGPASPLYGMGKIGGYTNMVPKSGRAKTGGYLTETQGFTQIGFGDYERQQISAGIGGPFDFLQRMDKRGGYYVYGLLEDSASYSDGVPVKQRILQAAINVDHFAGSGRLEAGASYQYSETAGALTGRFTQELVNNGRYIRGTPLVNLDLNGNGRIGYLEMQNASPVQGGLSVNNQPLLQTWAWPRDSNGVPLPISQFPTISGIPLSLFNYLNANPSADPTGLLRAQGVGGPQPASGHVPIGMALDPRSVGYGTLNFQRAAAFERELQAEFLTVFVDLIWDANPDFTVKNQLFFDGMDQYKTSNQPFSTTQTVFVWEDKFTVSKRLSNSSWLSVNSLMSLNYRNTVSLGKSLFGDFSTHRTDAADTRWIADQGGMTANTTFNNGYDNPDLYNDGYPWGGIYRTEFNEFGVGALLDVDLWRNTNVLAGGRFDRSRAKNTDYAGLFNATTGTAANPGRFTSSDVSARKWDSGVSWNISLAQKLPGNFHPYVSYAESSIVLDGNNNMLTNVIVNNGHLGSASLAEAGVKSSLLGGKLYTTLSAYEQKRIDIDATDDPALINAYASSTRTRGLELQMTASWSRHSQIALYALHQHTYYEPNVGGSLLVDARMLGFQDVTDAQGNVIYPAEAFLYGGRSRIALPTDMREYREKQGNPNTQIGVNITYDLPFGFSTTAGGNYFSTTCSGRLCFVTLPESYVFNAGLAWSHNDWLLKADIFNLTNERYFRARTGDALGDVLAQAMPDRHWQASVKKSFR